MMRVDWRVLCVVFGCASETPFASELTPFPNTTAPAAPTVSGADQFKSAIAPFSCEQLTETAKQVAAKAAGAATAQDKAYYAKLGGVVTETRLNNRCPAP